MKDNKLISMVEFTEEIEDYVHESRNYERGCKLIFERKDFVKQTLTLGMFIPCDSYGDILKEPMSRN